MSAYLLSIDQGTTSTRAIIFAVPSAVVGKAQLPHSSNYPQNGWVEQDPEEIWLNTLQVCRDALANAKLQAKQITAIGITNQRETTIVWDKATGQPIYPAIVWQDRRTQDYCADLQAHVALLNRKTGLRSDPYFSASKIHWLLENMPGARQKAERGELLFGTVDCFLIWRLTEGKRHVTDATNASRTLLFNIHSQTWDEELLKLFAIPRAMLPEVLDCAADFGVTHLLGAAIPIAAVMGDQQASLVGQGCTQTDDVKCTYGTGGFLMVNTGKQCIASQYQLLTTVAYRLNGEVTYALEGSFYAAGTIIKWLRDKLQIIASSQESERIAESINSTQGVYLLPAFTGLGAPYWDSAIRAAFVGMSANTGRAELVRAGLEAVAYQTQDLLLALRQDGIAVHHLKVDGNMAENNFLLQFLADVVGIPVIRAQFLEATSEGVAVIAALQMGIANFAGAKRDEKIFQAQMNVNNAEKLYNAWKIQLQKNLTV